MKGKFDAYVKFGFSEKATKFEKIFVDFLTSALLHAQNSCQKYDDDFSKQLFSTLEFVHIST